MKKNTRQKVSNVLSQNNVSEKSAEIYNQTIDDVEKVIENFMSMRKYTKEVEGKEISLIKFMPFELEQLKSELNKLRKKE
jgi:hypothetical protein